MIAVKITLQVVPPVACVFHNDVQFTVNGTGFLQFRNDWMHFEHNEAPGNISGADFRFGNPERGVMSPSRRAVHVRKRKVRVWDQFSFTIGQNNFSRPNVSFWAPNFTVHLPDPAESSCNANGQSRVTAGVVIDLFWVIDGRRVIGVACGWSGGISSDST